MGARPFAPRHATLAEEPQQRERPSAAGSAALRRGREAAALLLFAAAIFLSFSLLSFRMDPNDPSYHGADWMGPVGGSIAGFLVQGFGLVALLAPLELAVLGVPLLRNRPAPPIGTRVFGDVVVAIIGAALVHVSTPDVVVFGRALAGGNVGLVFGELMRGLFSTLGS
ncbi:MAG TPA: DNA translocase FtsK 4TM domain-containing protein, partial [Polyangiaceae bacterium]|nr:DNA translocase FtsK 4TM domain-containing protein [Polyangiaceae bacterium]